MKLSASIKKYRLARGLTQEQLATVLGVSAQAVSKWETTETYPDGALLPALADALSVSLDALFGREYIDRDDLAHRIQNAVIDAPPTEKMQVARQLCYQSHIGLFCSAWEELIADEDFRGKTGDAETAYALTDSGFTEIGGGDAPFFALFCEPEAGFRSVLGDCAPQCAAFARLGDPDVMRAVLCLHKKERRYLFAPSVLMRECEIPIERTDAVLSALSALHLVKRIDLDIDGTPRTLYTALPSHRIIGLLLYAGNLFYRGPISNAEKRQKPLL